MNTRARPDRQPALLASPGGPRRFSALRHIPSGRSPFDFSYAAVSTRNRWNDPGVPAVYLASGIDVVTAEYARHLDQSPFGPAGRRARVVYSYDVSLEHVLDLREP